MTIQEPETSKLEPIDPTGLWRLTFWMAYVLGTLTLLFSWLLSLVPRLPHGADFTLDYIVRSCAGGLMLISILMARRLWNIKNPLLDQSSMKAMRLVLLFAWVELAIALAGLVGIALIRRA
jgi:hypothetical protein